MPKKKIKLEKPTVGPIVGATTTNTVRLWGRGKLIMDGDIPRRCFGAARLKEKGSGAFQPARLFKMRPHFDFTGVTEFDGLAPQSEYEYQLGYFYFPGDLEDDKDLDIDWDNAGSGKFKTAKDDREDPCTIVFGSCRYILRFLGGYLWDERGDKTFRSIRDQIKEGRDVDVLLMVGDQIYADDLNFFFPDSKLDEFFARYQKAFSQKHIAKLMARVPTYMILDDHEIEDNWTQDRFYQSASDRQLYAAAMHAYQCYQVIHGPAFDYSDGAPPEKYWYTFRDGCANFFVMDTRTERFIETPMRQIISNSQMQALKSWLLAPNPGVKFIVSSVPFFPDQKDMSKDKWSGFDQQRIEILDLIRDNEIQRVVFLSGDIHCSMSSKLTCSTHPNFNIHSIISSSFFWPYPQGQAHIYKRSGVLTQSGSCNYEVSYTGKVHSDDNFTRIDVEPNGLAVKIYNRRGKRLGTENIIF